MGNDNSRTLLSCSGCVGREWSLECLKFSQTVRINNCVPLRNWIPQLTLSVTASGWLRLRCRIRRPPSISTTISRMEASYFATGILFLSNKSTAWCFRSGKMVLFHGGQTIRDLSGSVSVLRMAKGEDVLFDATSFRLLFVPFQLGHANLGSSPSCRIPAVLLQAVQPFEAVRRVLCVSDADIVQVAFSGAGLIHLALLYRYDWRWRMRR